MKKINLKGISEILSEKELKNVVGGGSNDIDTSKITACSGKSDCDSCSFLWGGRTSYGICAFDSLSTFKYYCSDNTAGCH